MNASKSALCALLATGVVALAVAPVPSARSASAIPYLWKNCTHVHTKYRHGVGKLRAHDHTKSGTNPVTNFYRSTKLYNRAMGYNRRLDADKDGIACEQH